MIDAGRSGLKRLAERCLVAVGGPAVSRALRRDRDVVLAYHDVVPDGGEPGGDASLHLARADFARQLDRLVRSHRVVALEELFGPGGVEAGDEPRAVLTFDDGYRGALTAGVEELVARGLPATFFVAPGLSGRDGVWWDELAAAGGGGVPEPFRGRALDDARGRHEEVYALAAEAGLARRPQPRHAGIATAGELRSAASKPGIRLASHTWSHPNLARLDVDELSDELERPLAWLREHHPEAASPWLSLPYGRSRPGVAEAARRVGYAGVLRIAEGGMVGEDTERNAVPRRNVPAGLSADGFRLLTSGL